MVKTREGDVTDDVLPQSDLYYNVTDKPPILETIIFGFQLVVATVCYTIVFVVMLQSLICADQEFSSKMFSTVSFMIGVSTILQTCVGVRMPIYQGATPFYFLPYMTAATDPRWGCNAGMESRNETLAYFDNISRRSNMTQEDESQTPWREEWAKASGSLMLSQAVQVILALTGTLSFLMRYVRPVSIAVMFILIGVWLHEAVVSFIKVHWGISALSVALVLILSQYINWIHVPVPAWKRGEGFYRTRLPIFALFPVLIGVAISWSISAIITVADGFPDDPGDTRYNARTDIYGEAIRKAPVFTFPYPGQFSWIDFSLEYFLLDLVSVMMTTMKSMGDYCQCAVACYMPRPPSHAFNRGIFVEGLCGIFSAVLGMGHTTSSHSSGTGVIKLTKVASRRVFIAAGAMLMMLGIFGKVGAVFVSIPKSVLAGPVYVGISFLIGVGVMNLKHVDVTKTRNQTIIGCSIMIGVFMPFYFLAHPGDIDTGMPVFDRIILSFATVPFLVGGITAILLDNTLPGLESKSKTVDENVNGDGGNDNMELRPGGLPESEGNGNIVIELDHKKMELVQRREKLIRCFDPPFITKYTRAWRWTRCVHILPRPYKLGGENTQDNATTEPDTQSP